MLIDRAVEVGPAAGDLDVGLVNELSGSGRVPGGSGGVDEFGREALYLPVDRDVVDSDAALGQRLCDVAIGQPVAQLPAHRDRDHLTAGSGTQPAQTNLTSK